MPQADSSQPKTQSGTVDLPLASGRRPPGARPAGPARPGPASRPAAGRRLDPDRGRGRGSMRPRCSDRPVERARVAGGLSRRTLLRDLDPAAGRAGEVRGDPGSAEKQTPVLDGPSPPSSEDWVRLARHEHATARQLDQIAARLADALQEMKLNQVGSPKSHRLLQDEVIDPIRALGAGPLQCVAECRPEPRELGTGFACEPGLGSTASPRGCYNDEEYPRTDVAVGELRRRRQPGRRSHPDGAEGPAGDRKGP